MGPRVPTGANSQTLLGFLEVLEVRYNESKQIIDVRVSKTQAGSADQYVDFGLLLAF